EARTLQTSLFPNPEIELELENFGGAGDVRGVDSSESTFQLSQLIELGGKRAKRLRAAGLERDIAGWDYEAKRLEVLTEATKAFIDVLAAQERLALTEDVVRLSEQVHHAAEERVKGGKVPPLETTKARGDARGRLGGSRPWNTLEGPKRGRSSPQPRRPRQENTRGARLS